MSDYKNKVAYEKAKKRVENEKGFYSHLTAYVIINIALLFINADLGEADLNDWFRWNLLLTPILWGIGLIVHGIYVFGKIPSFSKAWEERKIKELMDKDDFSE
ncbi:2TM domain-containing protein [Aquimarina celericrescens]|uniref:2TM domain-containing protein n=1 Tax=Aquimarina celericrescens TaxID=1964542 RepID=A0ABW5ATV4_9FLAO|nr:2TM domain-containing protein [Aquimarina celericrescens]